MQLKEYILTYKEDNKIVANLFDYYENYIRPLDKSFEPYSYYSTKLVLCFFKEHADINPSMGFIKHSRHKDVLVCHCFGCGRTADVVRLHQIIESQYHNREITEQEACRELAEMFHIPIESDLSPDDFEGMFEQRLRKIRYVSRRYTRGEFSRNMFDMRMRGAVNIDAVNSECVKLIATVKQLYD